MTYRRDQEVRVFTGGGWEKGTYIRTVGESMLIQMPKKVVRVWDPRNVKELSDKRGNIERLQCPNARRDCSSEPNPPGSG